MKKISSLVKIVRLQNLIILGASVWIGHFLSHSTIPVLHWVLLVFAAMCTAAFGNVVNDIADIKTDAISHPDRPLPKNDLSTIQAGVFAGFLAAIAIATSFSVSLIHGTGVVIPLAVLWLYAVFFKGTPLLGNILVSLLVAYGPLFGALSAIHFNRIIIPALLAFLLNLIREIIKDVQDKEGDERAGIITTASLDSSVVRGIILSCAIIYVLLLFVPYLSHRFHAAYAIACFITVLPLHIFWLWQFKKENWEQRISKLSLYLKMEMVCGLLALLADEIWTIVSKSC